MDEACKKEVLEWLEKVSMDENTAHVIFEAHAYPKKFDALCFHCQQAAKKAMTDMDVVVTWVKSLLLGDKL